MSMYQRLRAEARRRAEVLSREVEDWKGVALKDQAEHPTKGVGKKGITAKQLDALKGMMDVLQERQTTLLNELDAEADPARFAAKYLELADEVVSAHEIWRIFRYIILLHKDDKIGPLVDAADMIAADCYLTCMQQMRAWGLVAAEQFRETPLVFLEAEVSPQTIGRGEAAAALGFPLRRYRDKKLPLPITLLPSDHASSLWLHGTLHHEVGHNLEQDLNVSGELARHLLTRLGKEPARPVERQRKWASLWVKEIVADAFGVLLGGAGFAHALGWWLLALAPEPRFAELSDSSEHPSPYVRVHLLAALLWRCGVPELATAAGQLEAEWEGRQKPAWVAEYTQDAADVADVLLAQPLAKLGGRPLKDFVPDLAGDAQRAERLKGFLLSGISRPDPKFAPATSAGIRLVPAAAQLAFVGASKHDTAVLDRIHDRALLYLSELARPPMMGVAPDRTEYFKQLVRALDLRH